MMVTVEQSFLYDDSNFNGLKPWEKDDYDMDTYSGQKKWKNSIDDDNWSYYYNSAVQLIENENLEFLDEFSKRDLYFKSQVKDKAKFIFINLHQRFIQTPKGMDMMK